MQKKAFAGNNFTGVKCKVYDVKKKELLGKFETISLAAKFLGLEVSQAYEIAKHKRRNRTNILGKIITIRLAS